MLKTLLIAGTTALAAALITLGAADLAPELQPERPAAAQTTPESAAPSVSWNS